MSLESKNKFLKTLDAEKQKNFKLLFDEFDKNDVNLDKWKKCFKEFIELQKDNYVIDLTEVCFLEDYDITKNDFIFEVFEECGILNKEECYINPKNNCNTNDKTNTKKYCFTINKKLNFSNSIFCKKIEFIRTTFEKEIIFEGAIFCKETNFICCEFNEKVTFEGSKFLNIVRFKNSIFKSKTKWAESIFKDYSSFEKAKFQQDCDFENIRAYGYFYFHEVAIKKLNLKGAYFAKPNFLALTNINEIEIKKNNFENKETVRILKDIFEKENNFSESNIYYPIEQEFLIDLLKNKNTSFPNKKLNLFSLYINKYVSNFGTDWFRVLLVMMIFGLGVGIIYNSFLNTTCKVYPHLSIKNLYLLVFLFIFALFIYITYIYKFQLNFFIWPFFVLLVLILLSVPFGSNIFDISNYIIQLINPLNVFSSDFYYKCCGFYKHVNYYEKFAIFGVIVKAITIALIYQFIISFRNSTRRK